MDFKKSFSILFFLAIVALTAAVKKKPTDEPVVSLQEGIVKGAWKLSTNGRYYASFEGIPYAKPPLTIMRLQDPWPPLPWQGIYDATYARNVCMQYNPFQDKVIGSEDCLFVNVYTPHVRDCANMPVMVFIHGGAFMFGSGSSHGPQNFMDFNFVVVTLNYRLGPLGFLSTYDNIISGNFGLKDQSLALRWTRDNIKTFGGNPDTVLLSGSSAGAASVHYHYLSPWSKGLFSSGFQASGTAFSSWAHQTKPLEKAKELADVVKCPYITSKELLQCLQEIPGEDIVMAQIDVTKKQTGWRPFLFTAFVPSIEAPSVKKPFLNNYPHVLTTAGAMHRLPLIASITAQEGLYPAATFITDPKCLDDLERRWNTLASYIFVYNDTLPKERLVEVAQKIKQEYFESWPVHKETFHLLIEALSDRLFNADIAKQAQLHALKSGQLVFFYKYTYRGSISISNDMAQNKENYGVAHADDIFNIFKFQLAPFSTSTDKKMAYNLIDILYNFATTGVPKLKKGIWQPLNACSCPEIRYLEIASPTDMKMKVESNFGRHSFWHNIGFLEYDLFKLPKPPGKDEL
ncbi:venom carboxylesterase-6-like [Hyposmocoma kahamanoa]|uniref:venom carboxylesterase-6-like n=1 Tax=Hyposmocoma kahamanoa TaxID=1477025 RepID=UPI000E6D7948|nr:venom carboxylesterase-6-like [Hyposmocoma kahamanoa]